MSSNIHDRFICRRCKRRYVEIIDGWCSLYCDFCNDKLAEAYREQKEWEHFHNDQD